MLFFFYSCMLHISMNDFSHTYIFTFSVLAVIHLECRGIGTHGIFLFWNVLLDCIQCLCKVFEPLTLFSYFVMLLPYFIPD